MPRLVVPILVPPREAGFAVGVEFAVQRQDQRDVLGDLERVRRHLDALPADLLDLVDEVIRVEHDAVADDRELAWTDDARGQQRELEHLAVDHQRVAGVVAALEADDDIGADRQPVDDLAFPLVAPLGADHDDIGHRRQPSARLERHETPAPDNKLGPGLIAAVA